MKNSISQPLEAVVRRDLVAVFRSRLIRDGRLVLLGHGLAIALTAVALANDGLGSRLPWWIGALVLTTLARAAWQLALGRRTISDREVIIGTRLLVALQGMAWGGGLFLLMPAMASDSTAVILISLSGIIASAGSTMEADPISMWIYVATILGPMAVGLETGVEGHSFLLTGAVITFGVVTLVLHRRAFRGLIESIQVAAELEVSHEETAHEKAYLEGLLRSAPLAVVVLDDAKRVRFVNDRFQQLFGYTTAQLTGVVLSDLLVPKDQVEEHERINRELKEGTVLSADVVRLAKGGRPITVRISAAPVNDPTQPGVVVMYEDITQERAIQATLQERERRLSRLMDANIVGIGFWDLEGTITEANDEYLRITGYDRADLEAGRVNFRKMVTPAQEGMVKELGEQLVRGVVLPPFEFDTLRKDGEVTPTLMAIAPLGETTGKGICFVLDVTAQREGELQLAQKTALLEAQVTASLDGILIVSAGGKTLLANDRFVQMWHIPPELAADPDDRKQLEWVVGQTKDPVAFREGVEYLYAHPDATSRDEIELTSGTVFDRYSAPVLGPGGEHHGRIWTFRDMTATKDAERTLREARALAEETAENRAMFLANMSHEIRTPMNAVLGMMELVLDSELSVEQRHYLALASTSAESLLGILNDVLDYSKIGAGRIDIEEIPFDLPRLIHSTAALLATRAAAKGVELVVDVTPGTPRVVRGDPTRFRQVVTNLLGNAVKFTEQGEVVVMVRAAEMEDGRPGIVLSVRDSGIGMTPEQIARLFEAFTQGDGSTTRRFGGTGLGLAISDRLVGLMGGKITVASTPGQGSEFTVALPFAVADDQVPAVPIDQDVLAGQVIVVVDDNAVNRHLLDRMLTRVGARVVEAENAAEALAQLRQIRNAGIDRVFGILDGRMPGVDGFELARQIRADPRLADTPLLMLTSSGQRGDAARCRELGVPGYLTKPVAQADLLEAVAAILHGQGMARAKGEVITKYTLAEGRERLHILLAEDNVVNQEVAAVMLRKRGHRVDIVADGGAAVAAVNQGSYDVVLMDLQMPEMDGYEATARIRALPNGGTLPIIALTAHAYGQERERCLAAGMNGFVTKPFKGTELFAAAEGVRKQGTRAVVAPLAADRRGTTAPAVDLEGFRAELRSAGVESAIDEILATFLEETPARLESLEQALDHGTAAEVGTSAHALKGSAAAIGAHTLATLLAEIEVAGESDTLVDREGSAAQVERETDAAMREVREYQAAVPPE